MPREELIKKGYEKSDILVYPGYSDSFGWAFLEAMSFGLPIITVNGVARRDLIRNGRNGFVVPRKMKKSLSTLVTLGMKKKQKQ